MTRAVTDGAHTLSMEEFRLDWEPEGWQLLVIGPTATWRTEWGEWEAIRDIVQNALDETEGYTWGYDGQGLWISDEGQGMAIEHFLLGPPRPKPPYARGRFGEGMKIAALALLRKGYRVRVETVGKEVWLVFLQVKLDTTAEQLAALWRPNGQAAGTTFHIIGYFGDAFADRFAVNIPREQILHQGPSPLREPVQRYNQLIASPPGRIYARDIYMRGIQSPFSYNLWGFELAPDRHAPRNESQMWADVGRVWATVNRVELLERFLGMMRDPPLEVTDEGRSINVGRWDMGDEPLSGKSYWEIMRDNQDAWREAWRRVMGENVVLRTDSRWDPIVAHLGYESVSVAWGAAGALGNVIWRDGDLVRASRERLRDAEVVPDGDLTPQQWTHLRLARAIAERFRFPPIQGVHAAIIPPASDRRRTAGLYNTKTEEILISVEQLYTARSTVDTAVHEIAHHTSQAEDMTPEHSEAMTQVAARVVEMVAGGVLDEWLKGVEW
jgi:hypothetical protein